MKKILKPIALALCICFTATSVSAQAYAPGLDTIPEEDDSFYSLSRTSSLDSSVYLDIIGDVDEAAANAAATAGIAASLRFFAPGSLTRNQKNNLMLGILSGFAGGIATRLLIGEKTTLADPGLYIDALLCKAGPATLNQFASMSQTALARIEDKRLETNLELGLGVLMAVGFGMAGAVCSVQVNRIFPPKATQSVQDQLNAARTWYNNYIDEVQRKKAQWTRESKGYCLFDCSTRNNAVNQLKSLQRSELDIYRILNQMEALQNSIRTSIGNYNNLQDRQLNCFNNAHTSPECGADLVKQQVGNITNGKEMTDQVSALSRQLANEIAPFMRKFTPLPAIMFPPAPQVGGGLNANRTELRR